MLETRLKKHSDIINRIKEASKLNQWNNYSIEAVEILCSLAYLQGRLDVERDFRDDLAFPIIKDGKLLEKLYQIG